MIIHATRVVDALLIGTAIGATRPVMLGQDRVRGPSELSGASGLVQYDNDRLGWSDDQRSNETRDVVFPNDRVSARH